MDDVDVFAPQREAAAAMRRPRLAERVTRLLSGSFPLGLPALGERERGHLAGHLEESARRALASQVRMDALMFRMTLAEAEFSTPAVDMLRSAAAAVRDGAASAAVVAGLDVPQRYGVSALLESATNRARREDGTPYAVSDGCGRLWAAWDSWAGVSGSPAERSWRLAGAPRGEIVHD